MSLFKELNKQTIATAKETGLPYHIFSEKEQEGETFGERLTNSIVAMYARGYEKVIAIGNDTPHLSAAHILSAQESLVDTPLVLGPSTDGGFYMMGLRKSHFHPTQFKNLPWQSAQLSEVIMSTLSRKRNTFKPQLLPTLSDIDTLSDLAIIAEEKESLSEALRYIFQNILSRTLVQARYTVHRFFESLKKAEYNKGSPVLICL